jgi:hypothetical protein
MILVSHCNKKKKKNDNYNKNLNPILFARESNQNRRSEHNTEKLYEPKNTDVQGNIEATS